MLPLAAFAGLRITRLDEHACSVRLPGGWRTRNPFGSTYFAAQAMAAEMSTGAPGLALREDAPRSVSMLPVGVRASYLKRLTGPGDLHVRGRGRHRAKRSRAPRPRTSRSPWSPARPAATPPARWSRSSR